ncbi:cation ABC transporter [Gracilibacillus halophilus YIM-C55.5]|uniref:Cation ABC transporter n=1 Tax=Gracilibacillus halophilus YIM-C55.5 TaxID=1308866 RepID=N4WAD9_9BACI|nr:ABC transporter ATP-binding protein [Gracilibacillus halophilus]ENH97278.1 cation ABC transporter [Gracilibacillus halophilus YIM-C55.5]
MTCENAISVDHLRLKFSGEKSFLMKDFSLSIQKNEKVLIVGPSGSGKSTLLQVLSGLIPNSVEVPVTYQSRTLPNAYGYVFQDPDAQFCMPYVDEELAFVLENMQVPHIEMEDYIQYYLHLVGLKLTNAHTKISELSGGMKQRLAIASAMALQPDILFLDEPTAMLDPEGTQRVWDTIKQVSKEQTVVIVEHKIEKVLDYVDRVVFINQKGQIVADDNPQTVWQQHRSQWKEHGIWYPGVWNDYIRSHSFHQFADIDHKDADVLVQLSDFKVYRNKKEQVSVDNMTIAKGDLIAIRGINGSGKSTFLLGLIELLSTAGTCIYNPDSFVDHQPIYQQIGFVFQNPELQFVTDQVYKELEFSLTNIDLTDEEKHDWIDEMLQQIHLKHTQKKHPYELSTGEKKRLSIATAIINRPPLVLLDEPTFGQDARNTFEIMNMIQQLQKLGTAIVMVTHDDAISNQFATQKGYMHQGNLSMRSLKEVTFTNAT